MRRLRYTFVFALLAAVCGYWAYRLGFPLCALLGNLTACWAGVAVAFLSGKPGLLGKRSNGQLKPIAWLVYWPYVLLSIAILKLSTRLTVEPAVSKITPHLLLGRRLSSSECKQHLPDNLASTVDLTAEFPESAVARRQHYLCIPTLDTLNPTLEQLTNAVAFIKSRIETGPAFIHCAMGHGRSATVVAAYLMFTDDIEPHEAIARLKAERPGVGLHAEQIALLNQYQETLHQPSTATPPPDTGSGGSRGCAD